MTSRKTFLRYTVYKSGESCRDFLNRLFYLLRGYYSRQPFRSDVVLLVRDIFPQSDEIRAQLQLNKKRSANFWYCIRQDPKSVNRQPCKAVLRYPWYNFASIYFFVRVIILWIFLRAILILHIIRLTSGRYYYIIKNLNLHAETLSIISIYFIQVFEFMVSLVIS